MLLGYAQIYIPFPNIIILEHKSDCINSEIEKYGNDIAKIGG